VERYDVVLRFAPQVADEIAAFQFHPTQTLQREPDGLLAACAKWLGT
jgi:hypothetical protein